MRSGAGRAGDEASGGPVLINNPPQPLRRRGQRLKLVRIDSGAQFRYGPDGAPLPLVEAGAGAGAGVSQGNSSVDAGVTGIKKQRRRNGWGKKRKRMSEGGGRNRAE